MPFSIGTRMSGAAGGLGHGEGRRSCRPTAGRPRLKTRGGTRDVPSKSCYSRSKACRFQSPVWELGVRCGEEGLMHGVPLGPLAMPPSATGGIARRAAARVTEAGLELGPLLHKAHLTASQIQDHQARLAVADQISFLNLVAEAQPDDLLGFHLAQAFEPREVGLLYLVLASSATLGEAMARAERYSTITNEGIRLWCQEGSDFRIRYSYVGVSR